jgi:hypothetical protein
VNSIGRVGAHYRPPRTLIAPSRGRRAAEALAADNDAT